MTYGMHECLKFIDVWRLYPVKTQFYLHVLNIDTVEKEHVEVSIERPGRRGQLTTRGSYRSGRAQFGLPAPRTMESLHDGKHC